MMHLWLKGGVTVRLRSSRRTARRIKAEVLKAPANWVISCEPPEVTFQAKRHKHAYVRSQRDRRVAPLDFVDRRARHVYPRGHQGDGVTPPQPGQSQPLAKLMQEL